MKPSDSLPEGEHAYAADVSTQEVTISTTKTINKPSADTSSTVRFADVAHQTLLFDRGEESSRLILELIDTSWVQRLRQIRQTGVTNLVYMFSEHSRFGHSLGVAYLAKMLMESLERFYPAQIEPYKNAVSAAALLHDIGHVAPGSHLAERIWGRNTKNRHELLTARVIAEDPEISSILSTYGADTQEQVIAILSSNGTLPPWTSAILSGGGWNADRGNWAIVDSAMCSVSYGRYNVAALIDAFRLTEDGQLVIRENRLDALTHFFVARESMYRQVYQHRVLQAADALLKNLVVRLHDLLDSSNSNHANALSEAGIFVDDTMLAVLRSTQYTQDLDIDLAFRMPESWWQYHVERWCVADDPIVRDLATRVRDRRLFKTIRIGGSTEQVNEVSLSSGDEAFSEKTREIAKSLGFDPRYYVTLVNDTDIHRGRKEEEPKVLLDSGDLVSISSVEPIVHQIMRSERKNRRWLAVPAEVKKEVIEQNT